jgi:hypothetical protein
MLTLTVIMAVSVLIVFAQAVAAENDGYFSRAQMEALGHKGYSFLQHGGMWADVTIIPFTIGWIVSHYHFNYIAWYSWLAFGAAAFVTLGVAMMYQKGSVNTPEAHAHDGKTTIAGWIHVLYAMVAMWIYFLFYFTPATPRVIPRDLILISIFMTPFFYLGVKKFNPSWKMTKQDKIQVIAMPAVIWVVAIIRIVYT